jgi:hypothetical protein
LLLWQANWIDGKFSSVELELAVLYQDTYSKAMNVLISVNLTFHYYNVYLGFLFKAAVLF